MAFTFHGRNMKVRQCTRRRSLAAQRFWVGHDGRPCSISVRVSTQVWVSQRQRERECLKGKLCAATGWCRSIFQTPRGAKRGRKGRPDRNNLSRPSGRKSKQSAASRKSWRLTMLTRPPAVPHLQNVNFPMIESREHSGIQEEWAADESRLIKSV